MGSTISRAIILRHPAPYSIKYSEECAASCEKYGIPYEFFDGYYTTDVEELNRLSGWRFPNAWVKEYCCTAGHLNIWRKIADEGGGAVAVFEHDAIVKRHLNDIEVSDGDVVFLGLRVDSRDDYDCPEADVKMIPIQTFEGTHAYAITPVTARRCVSIMASLREFPCPIDGLMGIHNLISKRLYLADPCPVVCEVGNGRRSFTQFESAKYNVFHPEGFLRGLKNKELYKYDQNRQRMVFNTEADYRFSNDDHMKAIPFIEATLEKLNINKNNPLSILEIGCFEGGVSCWIANNLINTPVSELYVVDTFEGSELEMIPGDVHSRASMKERFQYNINLTKARMQSYMIIQDSKMALPDIIRQNAFRADIIYIDGGKDHETVRSDISNAYGLLKTGAVVILNDIQSCVETIDEFVKKTNLELVNSTETQRAYIKKR
jgi:GR25 family glycosyltransferase involved in LPS biosynthesis